MKILVTGACGFIGRHLVDHLNRFDYDIIGLDKEKETCSELRDCLVQYISCDLSSAEDIQQHLVDVDVIVHLAGDPDTRSGRDSNLKNNVVAGQRLVEALRGSKVRKVIFLSSIKAESQALSYGAGKRTVENMLENTLDNEIGYTILRPAIVYGVGMKSNLLTWFNFIKTGRFPRMPESNAYLTMIGCGDLCELIRRCVEDSTTDNQIYTVCDGNKYYIRDVESTVREFYGKTDVTMSIPRFLLYIAGKVGDLAGLLGTAFPFNSQIYSTFCHEGVRPENSSASPSGFVARENFLSLIPDILAEKESR